MGKLRHITLTIPEHVYFNFKHKCSFFDMSRSDVVVNLIEKFVDGDFDSEYGLEGLSNERNRVTDASD